ncbi:MAG: calcium-binding protein [Pseudomonadota bacterium]
MSTITGTPADDVLVGTAEDDLFLGQAGVDLAQVAAASAGAVFRLDGEGRWVVQSSQGADTLDQVEALALQDGSIELERNEFQVNSSVAVPFNSSAVARLADGGFAVAWVGVSEVGTETAIRVQRFDASGARAGPETLIAPPGEGAQLSPSISGLDDGGLLVTWVSRSPSGNFSTQVFAERFGAGGEPQGDPFLVSAGGTMQSDPQVVTLSSGGYVIVWRTNNVAPDGSTSTFTLLSQVFDAGGQRVGAETAFAVSASQPGIDAAADGGYWVTWAAFGRPEQTGIFAQHFTGSGEPAGDALRVSDIPSSSGLTPLQPDLAELSDGSLVVTWAVVAPRGVFTDVYVKHIDASGQPIGPERHLGFTAENGQTTDPAVAALPEGGYVLTWTASGGRASPNADVMAQFFANDATPMTQPVRVNSTTLGTQGQPAVTELEDGYVATWTSSVAQAGVFAQRFDMEGNPVPSGHVLQAGEGANTLHFEGAAPVDLLGGAGDDVLQGGSGDDILSGGLGFDTVVSSAAHTDLTWQLSGNRILSVSSPSQGMDRLDSVERVVAEGAPIGVAFDAQSERLASNPSVGNDFSPSVAPLPDGGYLVAFYSSRYNTQTQSNEASGIYLQRFDSSGERVGQELRVDATVQGQQRPEVTVFEDGSFAMVWMAYGQSSSDWGQYVQRFDADGNALAGPTRVASTANDYLPSIAALADGGFAVSWAGQIDNGLGGYGVYAQKFGADGAAASGVLQLTTVSDPARTDVSALPDGGFAVVWGSGYSLPGSVLMQRVDASGQLATPEPVTLSPEGNFPAVATLQDGTLVVTWYSAEVGGEQFVRAMHVDAQGKVITPAFTVSEDNLADPAIAALQDGGYVITWHSYETFQSSAFAQRFDARDQPVGELLQTNATRAQSQNNPVVAALEDGGFLMGWATLGNDNTYDIFTQRFDANNLREGHLVLTGADENNVFRVTDAQEGVELVGGAGADVLAGGQASDVLRGGPGGDAFEFAAQGNGVDTLADWGEGDRIVIAGASFGASVTQGDGSALGPNEVQIQAEPDAMTRVFVGTDAEPGADVVVQLAGIWSDLSFGLSGDEIFWQQVAAPIHLVTGTSGNDRLEGSDADDEIYGLEGRDRLEGLAGNDLLDGGPGDDVLTGGPGNDRYRVDSARDRVVEREGEGVDTVYSTVSHTLDANVEYLVLAGAQPINGFGNSLDNLLVGNDAANRLGGGAGDDLLIGAGGSDVFVFDARLAIAGLDSILDFNAGEDRIELDRKVFHDLARQDTLTTDAFHVGSVAADTSDRVIYNPDSGALLYDPDGSGQQPAQAFVTLLGAVGEVSAANVIVT